MHRRTFLMALWIGILLFSFVLPVTAQAGGISNVSPAEGTVGTKLTLSGAGFGQKHGEVLIGAEKCKVLDWSDSEITCMVDKPQHSGEYTVTVLAQGDKKPAEPMTYDSFTMRRPQIIPADTPTGLLWDGEAVTIEGAFFGDQPGDVILVHREDKVQVERVKVLDWSMDSIRCKLPPQLAGKYVLVVRNKVGMDFWLINLSSSDPPMLVLPPGFIGDPARNNSSGITYNGKFYIFSIHIRCIFCNDSKRIQAFTFASGQLSEKLSIAEGVTDAQIVPLVIEDQLWVFHTGIHGDLYFTRFNGTSWESIWNQIPNVATNSNWEIAPVYNPVLKRIEIYHEYQGYVNWVYSNDYGDTWTSGGKVAGLTEDYYKMSGAPSALFFQGSNGVNYTVLAYKNAGSGGLTVFAIGSDGSRVKVDYPMVGIDSRPFLMDYDANYFLLIYSQSNSWPIVQKYYKATFQRTATADVPLDTTWETCWAPNAAINRVDGKVYLFWGWDAPPDFGGYNPSPMWIMTHISIY